VLAVIKGLQVRLRRNRRGNRIPAVDVFQRDISQRQRGEERIAIGRGTLIAGLLSGVAYLFMAYGYIGSVAYIPVSLAVLIYFTHPLLLALIAHLRGTERLNGRKIVMLEPRRLAARMSAMRMADTLGEDVGETVGFRVRLESKVSSRTRIEVVTEGILTRRLQSDPELADVGLLIFDEFHERSLDADLGLALALDIQRALRPDLKILVMSATLDDQAVAAVLGNAPVLASAHRPFPVETRYLSAPAGDDLPREMAAAVRRALADEAGSILAFLPGEGEIRTGC
jgi:hypothetical protein